MTIREKVAKYCLISNIMQGIVLVFVVGMMIMLTVLMFVLFGLVGESTGMLKDVNPDDVTAGWQVLFGAAGGFFGAFAAILIVGLIIFMVGPFIAQIVALIHGMRTYKKRDTAEFRRMVKNDSIIKLVINAGMILFGLISLPSSDNVKSFLGQLDDFIKIIVFCIPSIVCVVMSIMVLRNAKDIEELSDTYMPEYIEYNEDNSPYFGQ